MLSEKGSLRDTPLLKLLLSIHEQGLTGILYVKNEEELKVIYLSRGKLTWAISNSDADKLENILLQRNQVDKDVLVKIKREAKVSDSIGKILVEQGLITLEELIDSSREQLRRIIASLLKWKDGGFQFVKDTPPERLISLDLSITDFIIRFILEEVDVSEIWKMIGSLQVEFIKTPDTDKIERYNLSVKQRQLLEGFTGDIRLEAVLSRYTGGHRESLLKIIYFFLMAELLIKKEFDLSDSSDFDEGGFDYFRDEEPSQDSASRSRAVSGAVPVSSGAVESPSLSPKAGDASAPRSSAPQVRLTASGYTLGAPPVSLEKPVDTGETAPIKPEKIRKPMFADAEENPPRKSAKLLTLIMVSVTLILGGVIMLLLLGYFNETPSLDDLVKKKAQDNDIIQVDEVKSPLTPDSGPNAGASPATGDPTGITSGDAPDAGKKETLQPPENKEKAPESNKTSETPGAKTPETADSKKTEEKPAGQPVKDSNKNVAKTPMDYFLEGGLTTAADMWKREIIRSKNRYSILLELDCQRESIMNALSQLTDRTPFFLLARKSGNRICYLVLFGRYKTQDEGRKGLDRVPSYFWKQPSPPQVIDLAAYL